MSETVKLIIEIPKKDYEAFKELIAINIGGMRSGKGLIYSCLTAVKNGTPLDDVKAEIKALRYGSDTYKYAIDDVIEILDNIGKGDSE